jgi:hypothetical protein
MLCFNETPDFPEMLSENSCPLEDSYASYAHSLTGDKYVLCYQLQHGSLYRNTFYLLIVIKYLANWITREYFGPLYVLCFPGSHRFDRVYCYVRRSAIQLTATCRLNGPITRSTPLMSKPESYVKWIANKQLCTSLHKRACFKQLTLVVLVDFRNRLGQIDLTPCRVAFQDTEAENCASRPYNLMNDVFWDVTPCGSCKNHVSEELSASFIRVTRIGELGTTLAVTSNRRTLRRNTNCPKDR